MSNFDRAVLYVAAIILLTNDIVSTPETALGAIAALSGFFLATIIFIRLILIAIEEIRA